MNTRLGVAALPVVLLVCATAGRSESPPSYRPVIGWPSGAAGAPAYGTAPVSAAAVDSTGRVFVFQRADPAVLVFERDGRYVRSWSGPMFTQPHGARFDPAGNLWLTDSADHRVVKTTPDGKVLLTLGVRGEAGDDARHFNKPTDVAFGPDGSVYVSDGYGNSRVVRFTAEGRHLSSWGRRGKGDGEFNLPHSIVTDAAGRVYVADRENARVQVFDADGRFLEKWEGVGRPYGLFLFRQGQETRIAITDGIACTLGIFDTGGRLLARLGKRGVAPGEFELPHLLTVDARGAVYVTEVQGKRIQKLEPVP